MPRTQAGNGEDVLTGAEYADPFAVPRQMTEGRYAWQSGSAEPRAQGFEIWQGSRFDPSPPQSAEAWMIADSSPRLWRVEMPADLPEGAHAATVRRSTGTAESGPPASSSRCAPSARRGSGATSSGQRHRT
jgi:hypothetical protein